MYRDLFSSLAQQYARFRPSYPEELFIWIANNCNATKLAWDCACGSGQATTLLASRFDRVIATDSSLEQISHAPALGNVEYRIEPSEHTLLQSSSVDCIIVAQAIHWFALEEFYAEARRVLAPTGLIVVFSYQEFTCGDDFLMQHINAFKKTIKPYWDPARKMVDSGYSSLPFPFTRITPPSFTMRTSWTKEQIVGYLSTWSAHKHYTQMTNHSLVADLAIALESIDNKNYELNWPLTIIAGTKN